MVPVDDGSGGCFPRNWSRHVQGSTQNASIIQLLRSRHVASGIGILQGQSETCPCKESVFIRILARRSLGISPTKTYRYPCFLEPKKADGNYKRLRKKLPIKRQFCWYGQMCCFVGEMVAIIGQLLLRHRGVPGSYREGVHVVGIKECPTVGKDKSASCEQQ